MLNISKFSTKFYNYSCTFIFLSWTSGINTSFSVVLFTHSCILHFPLLVVNFFMFTFVCYFSLSSHIKSEGLYLQAFWFSALYNFLFLWFCSTCCVGCVWKLSHKTKLYCRSLTVKNLYQSKVKNWIFSAWKHFLGESIIPSSSEPQEQWVDCS